MRRTRRTLLLATSATICLTLTAGLALAGSRPAVPTGRTARTVAAPLADATPVVVGPADPALKVDVALSLRGRDAEGLRAALADFADPASPAYGQLVTPDAFGDRFGLPAADEDQLVATLTAAGLTVSGRVPQRTSLRVSGTVADLERVLGVTLQQLADPRTGATYVASLTPPIVPPSLAGAVAGILGLDPRLPLSALDVAAVPPPARGLGPRDLATAYGYASLWAQGIKGEGQSVAILQFGKDTDEDLAVFDSAFDIAGPAPERIAIGDGVAQAPSGFATEASLDTQVVRAVAPEAQILVYGFENTTSMASAVDTIVAAGRATIISLSYGKCDLPDEFISRAELALGSQSFAAAALAGVTMYAAAGDWGAFTCHTFDPTEHRVTTFWPSCADNVVGVGGTYLETHDDGSYLRETGWEDYLTTSGTGGGQSSTDAMPAWQVGPGVQNAKSNGMRQCPDVSAVADPDTGYLIYVTDQATGEGAWQMVGGTSAAAPLWAGIQALMQQAAAQQGIDALGFMAPRYYRIAQAAPEAFHDITRGGNLVDASGPGWDFATGVGTPNVEVLVQAVLDDIAGNP
jgi:kumamolisin